jgi:hypothetical protein
VDHDDDVSDDSGMFVSDATTVYSWSCHGTTWFWNEMNDERHGVIKSGIMSLDISKMTPKRPRLFFGRYYYSISLQHHRF